jgi:hypothetical protein
VDHLIQNGLLKNTAEGLTKFLLVNVSDYRDVKHVDQTIRDDISSLSDEDLEGMLVGGRA